MKGRIKRLQEHTARKRLEGLARSALREYGLPRGLRPVLLRVAAGKCLWRIEDVPGGGRYLLRMYLRPAASVQHIRSILLWQQALSLEAALPVPRPVPTENGAALVSFPAGGGSVRALRRLGARPHDNRKAVDARLLWLCALLEWMPGSVRRGPDLKAEHLCRVGSVVARMHRYAENFSPPAGFFLPRWDWERVFGEQNPLWERGGRYCSPDDMRLLRRIAELARCDISDLGEGSSSFGIIHRDLTLDNFLFHNSGEASIIDFDESGWGHYLFDLAGTVQSLTSFRRRRDRLEEALIRGYLRERPLPVNYPRLLKTFVAMRVVWTISRALLRPGWNPRPHPQHLELLRFHMRQLGTLEKEI
ncbi:MAG: phosphotransferase, partial [Rubrobacter sp.]|nr:phosphotransferase [Rubrobacter sp.]